MNKLLWLSVLLISTLHVAAQDAEGEKNVLFVGNSYTYFWNLPQHIAAMAQEQEMNIKAAQSTAGGSNWGDHIHHRKGLNSIEKIKNGNFDIVVIQNHSMSTIERVDSFMHFGMQLSKIIKGSGAQPMLYMTWSRAWNPFMIKTISEKYTELGRAIGAAVAPVGIAFDKAKKMRPDIKIYDADGSHPSPLGTYLASCVLYSTITKKPSEGISNRLVTKDINGEKMYLNIVSKEDALFCQKVSDMVVNEYLD